LDLIDAGTRAAAAASVPLDAGALDAGAELDEPPAAGERLAVVPLPDELLPHAATPATVSASRPAETTERRRTDGMSSPELDDD
jgi:hypothetical protein